MEVKKDKTKKLLNNDKILIKFTIVFLFPLFIVGLILRLYDSLKIIVVDFVKYKILKRKKECKTEDWWIL